MDTYADKKIMIRVTGVTKQYRLGQIGARTLQGELQSWWARKRGREDPNLRLSVDQRKIGQLFMALNGIDLTVYEGETLGIIGSNGAGKSTLLKLLSRITLPTEGDIDLYGRVSSMLEVGTGFNGQLTGRENIYMNGAILGMSRAEIDERLEDIIEFSEVRDFIDTPVKRYSSGMFVKLAFAVAAHLRSEIMIMDEVLAVGDLAFQKKCLEKMRQAAVEDGRTVLYVSHNMSTIRELCTRCIVMEEGRIVFDGDTDEAISFYLNHSLGENSVDMPLDDRARSGRVRDNSLRMTRLTLCDKTLPIYERGETLRIRVEMRVTEPLTDVFCRLTLRTETDTPLGTSYSGSMTLDAPGPAAVVCEMPLSDMAKGTLYADISFCRKREYGTTLLDSIPHAFRMEMNSTPPVGGWAAAQHGYMRLPDMTARQEETK